MQSHTAERRPLVPTDKPGNRVEVTLVKIAVKNGLQVVVDSPEMANPNAESWFAVHVRYPKDEPISERERPIYNRRESDNYHQKKSGALDTDVILTDCDTFYLCRRDLGPSRFVLNPANRATIITAISHAF